MDILYFLSAFVLKIASAEKCLTRSPDFEGYEEQCRGMAELNLQIAGPDGIARDIAELKKLYLTDKGYFMPKKYKMYADGDVGQYVHSNAKDERKICVNSALMKQLDEKISDFVEWLSCESFMTCGTDAFVLLIQAITLKVNNTAYLLNIFGEIENCNDRVNRWLTSCLDLPLGVFIWNHLSRCSKDLEEIFSNWQEDVLKTKTIITELLESSQKISKEVKEDKPQIIEDYAKAFDHLKSYCSSLDLFRHYNISVYFGLHGMQMGTLTKASLLIWQNT